jgi:hypothetical protein
MAEVDAARGFRMPRPRLWILARHIGPAAVRGALAALEHETIAGRRSAAAARDRYASVPRICASIELHHASGRLGAIASTVAGEGRATGLASVSSATVSRAAVTARAARAEADRASVLCEPGLRAVRGAALDRAVDADAEAGSRRAAAARAVFVARAVAGAVPAAPVAVARAGGDKADLAPALVERPLAITPCAAVGVPRAGRWGADDDVAAAGSERCERKDGPACPVPHCLTPRAAGPRRSCRQR